MEKNTLQMRQYPAMLPHEHRSALARYGVATVLVLGLMVVKFAFDPYFRLEDPFLLSSLSVLLATWFGGTGPGIFATFLSTSVCYADYIMSKYGAGGTRWVDAVELSIVLGRGGVVVLICHSMRAANQRALALAERVAQTGADLNDQENRLKLIADAVPLSVSYLNKDLIVQTVNSGYLKSRGLAREQVLNRHLRDIIGAESFRLVEPYMVQTLAGRGADFELSLEIQGKPKTVHVLSVPDIGTQGQVKGFISILDDITERRAAATEILRAKSAAEAAARTKSLFLANISHEIRTPLGAVMGFSELLTAEALGPEKRAKYAAAIRRNGALLSTIIDNVLNFSRIEIGSFLIDVKSVSLGELLGDMRQSVSLQAREKGLQLEFEVDKGLDLPFFTDPLRLQQILLNIFGNAIKFTENGTIHIAVARDSEGSGSLSIAVTDSGQGVAKEHLKNLFEPFSQEDPTSTRKFGGVGLGLALSREMARLLGGDLVLKESMPGQGSCFVVTVANLTEAAQVSPIPAEVAGEKLPPFSLPSALAANLGEGGPEGVTANPSKLKAPVIGSHKGRLGMRGMRILLVDDAPDNQTLVGHFLSGAGVVVDTAANGKEAIIKAESSAYDLLLMDLQMPIMDGYEATLALRRAGYMTPIIALTAHTLADERERCLNSGFNDHLGKPVNRQDLLDRIARYMPS